MIRVLRLSRRSIKSSVFLFAFATAAHAQPVLEQLTGKVVGVSDGDTLTVLVQRDQSLEQIKVRVSGIDAPEKAQAFGDRSRQGLSDCAFAKKVQVEVIKLDRYGRSVGKVISQGTDCGLRQIELGLAWHYKAYAREQSPADRQSYAAAEDVAHERKRGLWADPAAIPPWDFRRPK
jgi:endonuclease YncB( thermonuclease family)